MSLQSRLSDLITAIGADIKLNRSLSARPTYYRSTKWYTGRFAGQSGGMTLTQNVTYFMPFYLAKAVTFDLIGLGVLTAQTGSGVRAGCWAPAANPDWPGALEYDSGAAAGSLISTTGTGQKTGLFTTTLAAGLHFLGLNAQGGTAGVQVNRFLASFDVPFGMPVGLLNTGTGGASLTETGVAGAFGAVNSANLVENFNTDLVRIALRVA
jgi:hypothetical protein